MITRITTGIGMFLLIFLPGVLFSHTFVLPLICGLLSTVGVYEILKCFKLYDKKSILIPSMTLGLMLPLIDRYTFLENGLYAVALLVVFYFLYMFTLPVFTNNKISIDEISKAAIMTCYISIGFLCVVLMRDLENGQYLFFVVFLGACITDIFAYFTGMLFGRHKLSPIISPKKTIEGSIGGTVFCTLSFILYAFIINSYFSLEANYLVFAILGFITSIVSQIGDLTASAIKRKYDTKDYGSIFPGHGGVLDRFDSIIAVASVLYLLCFLLSRQ